MIWLAMLLGLLGIASNLVQIANPPPPNVVLIIADDLGSGELSSYGSTQLSTPNIDALAREGVRLTRFYAAASICSPSRAGLLTGRDPARFLGGAALGPNSKGGLPATEKTLAELLATRGYASAYVGKWHLGTHPEFLPTRHGFQEFYGLLYGHAQAPIVLYRNESPIESPREGPEAVAFVSGLTQRYTHEAIRFIEASKARPFLLVIGHAAAHTPAVVSDAFRGRSGRGSHGDSIVELDWSVGEINAALTRLGLRERTIVVFLSDNGSPGTEGNGDLKGGKWSPFEGGIRVPFVIRWPGKLPAGRVETRPAIAYDLVPTLAQWTGAHLPGYLLDGYDVSGMLAGSGARPAEEFLWSKRAYMSGRFKIIINKGTAALYDVETDPGEKRNLAGEHPEIVVRLKAAMTAREATLNGGKARASRARTGHIQKP